MEIEFPKEQMAFLIRLVDEGHFPSVAEAVRAAVRDQEQRLDSDRDSSQELRQFVAVGVEAADRGDLVAIEDGDIRREGLKVLEQRRAMRGT